MVWRWALLCGVLLTVIVAPFLVWGEQIERWTVAFLSGTSEHQVTVACVLGGLLASDILLPVPSSLVSTGCGMTLGFWKGLAVSSSGMTVACALGYLLGRSGGRPLTERMVGREGLSKLEKFSRGMGIWVLVAARPVPVLAEASVLAAGAAGMSFGRFIAMAAISNIAISAVYAGAGAFSAGWNSFLVAFLFSIACPGIAMFIAGRWRRLD